MLPPIFRIGLEPQGLNGFRPKALLKPNQYPGALVAHQFVQPDGAIHKNHQRLAVQIARSRMGGCTRTTQLAPCFPDLVQQGGLTADINALENVIDDLPDGNVGLRHVPSHPASFADHDPLVIDNYALSKLLTSLLMAIREVRDERYYAQALLASTTYKLERAKDELKETDALLAATKGKLKRLRDRNKKRSLKKV